MTGSRADGTPTARGVLDALNRVCRDLGIGYGDLDSDDRLIAVTPTGPGSAVLSVVGGDDEAPTVLAAFTLTVTPTAIPRPATAADVADAACPAGGLYPHPRHFWRGTETGGWETVPTPTPDSSWCSGGTT